MNRWARRKAGEGLAKKREVGGGLSGRMKLSNSWSVAQHNCVFLLILSTIMAWPPPGTSCSDPWASPSFSSLNDWGPYTSVLSSFGSLFSPSLGFPWAHPILGPQDQLPAPHSHCRLPGLNPWVVRTEWGRKKRKSLKKLGQQHHLHYWGTCPSRQRRRPHRQWYLSHSSWDGDPTSGTAHLTTNGASSPKIHQHHPGPRAAEAGGQTRWEGWVTTSQGIPTEAMRRQRKPERSRQVAETSAPQSVKQTPT